MLKGESSKVKGQRDMIHWSVMNVRIVRIVGIVENVQNLLLDRERKRILLSVEISPTP